MNDPILPLDREQAEKLTELGYRLQQLRQKQRISLEQVAAKTMIPKRTLAAIEVGDRDQLPEPVYIQGFIRRYADAIGIDGTEFAAAFPIQTPLKLDKPFWRGPLIQAQLRPLHLYLLYMVLVIGAVSGLSFIFNRSTSPQVVGLTNTAIPNPQPSPNQSGAQASSASPAPSTSATTVVQKPVRVGMKLTAQSWMRVVVDGKAEFEGVMAEGTQRTWLADKQVVLRAGNAGGVMVSFNDGKAKRMGDPGSVEEVTFGSNAASGNLTQLTQLSADFQTLTASAVRSF